MDPRDSIRAPGRRAITRGAAAAVAAAALLALGAPEPASARGAIFMYEDERGVTHFTSDPRGDKRFQPVRLTRMSARVQRFQEPRTRVYDELIGRTARSRGVPPALVKAVIAAESAFDALAVSHKGAQGLMQLMPETAASLGVANPFVPAENVNGGTQYLRAMIDRYGDLARALAAYNAGPTAVDRYGGIPPYRETRAYVERVLTYYRRYHGDFHR